MKLASLALVAGGAVFGVQVGGGEVHGELRTQSLVIEGPDGNTRITSSFGGGVLMELGRGGKYGGAELEVSLDAGGWSMELRDAGGASVKARVADHAASIDLESAPLHSSSMWTVGHGGETPGDGTALLLFSTGKRSDTRPADSPCYIGAKGDHGLLAILERFDSDFEVDGEPVSLWKNVIRAGGGEAIGPWDDEQE